MKSAGSPDPSYQNGFTGQVVPALAQGGGLRWRRVGGWQHPSGRHPVLASAEDPEDSERSHASFDRRGVIACDVDRGSSDRGVADVPEHHHAVPQRHRVREVPAHTNHRRGSRSPPSRTTAGWRLPHACLRTLPARRSRGSRGGFAERYCLPPVLTGCPLRVRSDTRHAEAEKEEHHPVMKRRVRARCGR